jgi:hypothetical protein
MLGRSRLDTDIFTAIFAHHDIDCTIVAILVDNVDGEVRTPTS